MNTGLRDLDASPLWRAEDLGKPVPDDGHAVSVALPLWEQVIGYEEGDPAVLDRFQAGYPRFFCHPKVEALFARARMQQARAGEDVLVFPSEGSAARCRAYLKEREGADARVVALAGGGGLFVVCFPEAVRHRARFFWRISGEIVSSRLAEATLAGPACAAPESRAGAEALQTLRSRLAGLSGQRPDDVFVFPSGMAGIFSLHRALQEVRPGRKCVQLDFPYVDVLKVQQEFGDGVVFLPTGSPAELEQLEALLRQDAVSGIYCEFPSNPLLRSVDLERVSRAARAAGVPVIVDDTIASVINVDVYPFADVVTTSLTKYFSGTGNVMAGSVILNAASPHRNALAGVLAREPLMLWHGDAVVLERNSRDFPGRMRSINANAIQAYEHLRARGDVAEVYFPLSQTPELYRQAMRSGAGYGGLLSMVLRDPSQAPAFYDAMRLTKGPSLGTNFSIACPYTLLAHYNELAWAEDCGVHRNLIRISVGINGIDPSALP